MSDLFTAPTAALRVSELNEIASTLLDSQLSAFWIGGEVSNLTRAASGHQYFVLKDSHAQVRCAMFKHLATRLPVPLRDGAQIEVRGKIAIYAARGEFQIAVQDVRQIGAGLLHIQFEHLKNRLQNEGLFDTNRKQKLPEMPQTVGIVSSLAAAALRDVVSTLRRRAPHLAVVLYPTAVQGVGSSAQIAQAIATANSRREVDVLIVCRGGGSLEDLWAFNEEPTVRAISGSHIPIVCGVGHETDFTLSDMAADVRAPTPTAAAELVSPSRDELRRILQEKQGQLSRNLRQRYQNASQAVDFVSQQLRSPKERNRQSRQNLLAIQEQLRFAMQHHLQTQQQKYQQIQTQFRQQRPNLAVYRHNLGQSESQLRLGMQQHMAQKNLLLQHAAAQLEGVSPLAVLRRGFAIVRDSKGQIVRSSQTLQVGQKLDVHWADEQVRVQVVNGQQDDLFD